MNNKAELLYRLGEPLAAGMYEHEHAPIPERYGLGICRYFENVVPPEENDLLYPGERCCIWKLTDAAITFHYSFSIALDEGKLRAKAEKFDLTSFEKTLLNSVIGELRFFLTCHIAPRHMVGGAGWTHSILNYRRILKEGLGKYCERVGNMKDSPLKKGLQYTLDGICDFLKRAPGTIYDEVMNPAKDFKSAMRSFTFICSLDQYDSIGRFDDYMGEYFQGEPEAPLYLDTLFRTFDTQDGWNMLYTNKYPEFTALCLKAQKYSRPNSCFLISETTDQKTWDRIFDLWESGVPCPALYNSSRYQQGLEEYSTFAPEDIAHFAFGGCTELMIEGCSNIGSVDAGINLPAIYTADPDGDFYGNISREIDACAIEIRQEYQFAAQYRPQLIRTLFIDDCISRETEFNAGGARCNGSVLNVGGLPDAVNILAARQGLPEKYGNDNPETDKIAAELGTFIFKRMRQQRGRHNGPVFPASIVLNGYAALGYGVDAAPGGRKAGDPIADSIGAIAGTDKNGLTALLKSAAALNPALAIGTPVLNVRLQKSLVTRHRQELKALITTYFSMGGMQLQPTIADQETLKKAYENPEAYPHVIIRIGGFSEYYCRLSKELQRELLKRTEHTI